MINGHGILYSGFVILVFSAGIWGGGTIATNRADQHLKVAVANAVSAALEANQTPLNCKDSELIGAIKTLASNGTHIENYWLRLNIGNIPEGESWRR